MHADPSQTVTVGTAVSSKPEAAHANGQAVATRPYDHRELVGACFWITTRCNLSCDVCYASLYSEADNTLDGYLLIVDKLAEFGFTKVALTGGDPLLVRSLPLIVARAAGLGIKTAVTTNGKLLSPRLLADLEPHVDEMTLPFDGLDEQTSWAHRTNRHRHGHVIELVEKGDFGGIALDISTVVTPFNRAQLVDIGQFLEDSGVKKWKVFEYSALNRRSDVTIDFRLSDGVFDSSVRELHAVALRRNWRLGIDARSATADAINSYVNVLPQGSVLLGVGAQYLRIGSLLNFSSRDDFADALQEAGFSFTDHLARHHRDIHV